MSTIAKLREFMKRFKDVPKAECTLPVDHVKALLAVAEAAGEVDSAIGSGAIDGDSSLRERFCDSVRRMRDALTQLDEVEL